MIIIVLFHYCRTLIRCGADPLRPLTKRASTNNIENDSDNENNDGNHNFNIKLRKSKMNSIDQTLKYPDNVFAYAASLGAINALRIMLISDPTAKCVIGYKGTRSYDKDNVENNTHSSIGFYYGHNKYHSNPLSYAVENNHVSTLRYLLTTTFSCLSNCTSVEDLNNSMGINKYGEILHDEFLMVILLCLYLYACK
jgi:hypothetical protein